MRPIARLLQGLFVATALVVALPAGAQTLIGLDNPATPAKQLFGAQKAPVSMPARAFGFYSRGCLAGAVALPVNGRTWQVMRLSRNRNWGHPDLVAALERLAERAPGVGWRGLLVGDLAQPRGGPMLTGHASHQLGLDADIWLNPMPDRVLSDKEREETPAISVVASDWNDVDPKIWTPRHLAIIKLAASDPLVERVLVNPAIKKAICREATGDRSWLRKVRPYWGHNYHMHVRIGCPAGSPECRTQDATPPGDGCGKDLDWWFGPEARKPANPNAPKPKPVTLADLPAACRQILTAK